MPKSQFYDIVKMDDLRVSILKTNHFSIGTSPYYAHQHGLAIDIYQDLSLENYEVLSPVSGRILKIKTLLAPKPKFEGGIDKDYLILITNPSNLNVVWKLMHVNPYCNVGDQIEIGDVLGKTIRNGYFAYWSSPHLHLELRTNDDAIRARGGKTFSLAVESKNNQIESPENEEFINIPIEIDSIFHEFILARFPKQFYYRLFPIYGVKVQVDRRYCILDGGIPHYKIGTILCNNIHEFDVSSSICLGSHKIGTLDEKSGNFGLFKFKPVKFLLNNKEIRGISLYLAKFLPLIKVIPFKNEEFSFKTNTIQYLTINYKD
ncbi:MAG: hypothetical protein ACFE94_13275 [Candidatus Hodarchaeota archaeon]